MRVVVATIGTRGDTEPAVALALGLCERGHDVVLVGPKAAQGDVDGRGIEYRSLEAGRTDELTFAAQREHVVRQFDVVVEATEGADALVCSQTFSAVALSLKERYGTPVCVYGLTPPFVPTREFANPWLPALPLGRLWNRASYRGFEQLLWQPVRRRINRWRREALGLGRLPLFGYFERLSSVPRLVALSRNLYPAPGDWPPNVRVTGRWFLEPRERHAPAGPLVRFLAERDSPPVCITFGSNPIADRERMLDVLLAALGATGQRGIIVGGTSGIGSGHDLGPSAIAVDAVPYAWLFPQTRLVIHHGGAGATAHALQAGVPSIVVPTRPDQWAFGRRLHQLGAAPRPLGWSRLTAGRLTRAISLVLADESMSTRARGLSFGVRSERGVDEAIRIIEHHAGEGRSPSVHPVSSTLSREH